MSETTPDAPFSEPKPDQSHAWFVCEPNGELMAWTCSLVDGGLSIFHACTTFEESWEDIEKRGYTCRKFKLNEVPNVG